MAQCSEGYEVRKSIVDRYGPLTTTDADPQRFTLEQWLSILVRSSLSNSFRHTMIYPPRSLIDGGNALVYLSARTRGKVPKPYRHYRQNTTKNIGMRRPHWRESVARGIVWHSQRSIKAKLGASNFDSRGVPGDVLLFLHVVG